MMVAATGTHGTKLYSPGVEGNTPDAFQHIKLGASDRGGVIITPGWILCCPSGLRYETYVMLL